MKMLSLLLWLALNLKYILLILIGLSFVKWHWNRRKLYMVSWKLDGGFSWPLIGNLFDIFRYRRNILKYAQFLTENYRQPARFWMGPFFCVFIAEPTDLQIILNHPNALKKTFIYGFGEDFVGNSLLISEPKIWRTRRKIIEPTFNIKVLEMYLQNFEKCAENLCCDLESTEGSTVNVFNHISKCFINIISETVFDTKLEKEHAREIEEMIEAKDNIFDILLKRAVRLWLYPDEVFRKTDLYRKLMKSVNVFRNYTENVYEKKVRFWKKTLDADDSNTKVCPYVPGRFIDDLIYLQLTSNNNEKYEPLTATEIQREMDIMFAAGSDTSSHSISFALLLLAMFPDVQEKLFQEVVDLLDALKKENCTSVGRQELNRLEYMDMVLNETMRLFPPTPLIARELTGPIRLSNGVVLPEKTTIGVGICSVHRNRKIWGEDADKFIPDRFNVYNVKQMENFSYSFIPFSAGSRNCIGLKFARLSIKIVLMRILEKFKVETTERFDNIECEVTVLAKKIGGWNMSFKKR